MLNSIYGVQPEQLHNFLASDFPVYHSRQLLKWIYGKKVFDPYQMTYLPITMQNYLAQTFDFSMPRIVQSLKSIDGSQKFRLSLSDEEQIEMVLMPETKKLTLCVSSQVGCARNCAFCATGKMKLHRNLYSYEIVQQFLLASQESTKRITNLVFMGMGEPLDNLENVLSAIKLIQNDTTLAFSPRRTTISTCGIVPGIYTLADSGVKVKLAVSLNSAHNSIRDELMPVNRKYPLTVLKKALLYFQKKNPFRITLEYILIPGVNMNDADLKALRQFSGDLSCKINFIPFNTLPFLPYLSPAEEELKSFLIKAYATLPQTITLRRSRGLDIQGACGQLVVESRKKIYERCYMNEIEYIARKLFGDNPPCKCGGGHQICLGCAICRADQPDQLYDPSADIASVIDATLLKADATQSEVNALCDLANDYKCAAVCVNSHFSHPLQLRLTSTVKSCTVINFPLGASYIYAVAAEALAVINTGIEELDMVQNLSAVKSGHPLHSYQMVKNIAEMAHTNDVLLKVILETCYLSREEIITCALYAKKAGADFVKTSTGFGTAGATVENVRLLREIVGPKMGVKAAGGIRTREQAIAMLDAGANRIGASNVKALL